MCGITGYFNFNQDKVDRGILERMNAEIVHRGPDADGFFVSDPVGLAMRRLKVIDLSTGNQPIYNEDKTLCIIFNGEIYNYRELREELLKKGHKFQTHSDTEVIVHLYQERGPDCLQDLFGMFAFAIYDFRKQELFLARDRLGIKPLFYHQSQKALVFGSEIKSILSAPWVDRQMSFQAISHFLSLNYLPQPWTGFEGIHQLPPGHWLRVTKQGIQIEEWWDIPTHQTMDEDEETVCRKILELLHRSMERRLIADVPIGCFLSGGLDSSALVWLMKEHRHGTIKTFSAGFDHPAYDETPYARQIAKHFGTDHHEVHCTAEDVFKNLPKIAWHADNLLADQAALPLYLVSDLAKKQVTVCLSGDGGDEIFIGYPTFHADRFHRHYQNVPNFLRRNVIEPLVKALPASVGKVSFEYKAKKFIEAGDFHSDKAHYWWRTIYNDREKESLLTENARSHIPTSDAFGLYENYFKKTNMRDSINRNLYADMKVWLVGNNLYKVDTMTMAHGLEARVPFLDHELVEYMATLPSALKFRENILKYLMKKILKGKLPEPVLSRKKAGFHSPIAYWFREKLHAQLQETLLDDSAAFHSVVRKEAVEQMIAEHKHGKSNHAYRLWGLLILRFWIRAFLEGARS